MNKQLILFIVAVVIIGILVILGYQTSSTPEGDAQNQAASVISSLSAGNPLVIEDIVVGTGAEAVSGGAVTVHYVGTLVDGTVFDSSLSRGEPFTFNLGVGEVIPGWEQGVAGMKEGGKRRLYIAPELAYGAQAVGPIPANSALIFEVELVSVAAPVTSSDSETATTTDAETDVEGATSAE